MPRIVALSLAVLCLAATPAFANDVRPEEQVRQVLLGRNADLRVNLLRAWLVPPEQTDAARIRALAADVYASEARLLALGLDRPMMRDGAALPEVPFIVLADRARVSLDPWAPFAGRSFAIRKETRK